MGLGAALKSAFSSSSAAQQTASTAEQANTQRIPSVCQMCVNTCGIIIKVENGVVEGNPDNPHNYGRICAKGISTVMGLYDPHRVLTPLKRTNPVKGIGVDPKWEPIDPEDAWQIVVKQLQLVFQDDPRKLLVMGGTGDPESVGAMIGAFGQAFGTPNAGTGTPFGAKTWANYLNTGSMHTEPDFRHCRYLVLFGSQKATLIGHDAIKCAQAMADARERGMKLVVFDPICTPIASKADEWIPIRPSTDRALALSLLNVLLNDLGIYDTEFLRAQTNSAYLVNADGRYLREAETGKPLVWNEERGAACAYDSDGVRPALVGDYPVAGTMCQPAFQVLKKHLLQYSPEKVETITDVPAETIRRLALEFGTAASIGSTITIEGHEMPLRPVCAFPDCRGLAAHMNGVWTSTSVQLLNVMMGAVDVPEGISAPMSSGRTANFASAKGRRDW
jgi:anaerobic selenocysteine-containing dehydrogenase